VNAPERALATIELGAIERNCARLPKPLCAVVKSDGYGHGPVAAAALAGGAAIVRLEGIPPKSHASSTGARLGTA